jgi:hypothetical protein
MNKNICHNQLSLSSMKMIVDLIDEDVALCSERLENSKSYQYAVYSFVVQKVCVVYLSNIKFLDYVLEVLGAGEACSCECFVCLDGEGLLRRTVALRAFSQKFIDSCIAAANTSIDVVVDTVAC